MARAAPCHGAAATPLRPADRANPLLESRKVTGFEPTMGGEGTESGGEQSSAREGSVPIEAPVTKWFEVREGLGVAGRNAQVAGDGPDGRATNGG